MARPESPNRRMLLEAAMRLGMIADEAVFVGGQVTELLITDPAAARIRPTDDVDVVVRITTPGAYQRLGDRLKEQGFREDTRPRAPLCRWRHGAEITLDVMPIEETVLGFANQWYHLALDRRLPISLSKEVSIYVPEAPVFIATKFEAFNNRGLATIAPVTTSRMLLP